MLPVKKQVDFVYMFCYGSIDIYIAESLFASRYFSLPRQGPIIILILGGKQARKKIYLSNISKEHALNLSITFGGDWEYDDKGNNIMLPPGSLDNSCAGWLTLPGGTYLSLKPGENREIDLNMTVPIEGIKGEVQTAMLYVTQMNPLMALIHKVQP